MSDASYTTTKLRVEDYFDRSATRVWAQLTSDAKVSRIRQTVREGRDQMRATMLSRLPADLRGADVVAVDLLPLPPKSTSPLAT